MAGSTPQSELNLAASPTTTNATVASNETNLSKVNQTNSNNPTMLATINPFQSTMTSEEASANFINGSSRF